MTRLLIVICSAVAISSSAVAAETASATYQPGMLIKGDQEAPLVLNVVPWQEPRVPEVPEADLQPVLPRVLDDDYGILQRARVSGGAAIEDAAASANRSK